MLTTLLSLLGGGLMRMLPEFLSIWNKKTDNQHELAMMDKQLELARFKGQDERETIALQGSIDFDLAAMQATIEGVKAQGQLTGIRWVDAMNFLVRPLATYYFLLVYGVVKLARLVIAIQETNPWVAIITCWTEDDATILSGILAFWFVGRVFDKRK